MTRRPPPLPWLEPGDAFPDTRCAWGTGSPAPGLLAAGGALAVDTLLRAYRGGIFPWFSEGEPILWWSPSPRMVFPTDGVHLSTRFRRTLRKSHWVVRADTAFDRVIDACADTPRERSTTLRKSNDAPCTLRP